MRPTVPTPLRGVLPLVKANIRVVARPAERLQPNAARAHSLSPALNPAPRRETDLVTWRPVLGSRGEGLATSDAIQTGRLHNLWHGVTVKFDGL